MENFLIATGVVALAEIGDKTQLLSFVLAARFRKPWPIIAGILVATLGNHALAAALGAGLAGLFDGEMLRWVLGVSFLGMALWMLVPDKLDADTLAVAPRWGVFGSTALAFFRAEMGDKTQIATVALAAQTHAVLSIVLGTTFGMLLANVPAVLVGDRLAARLPVRLMHVLAALLFAALGLYALCGAALPGV